VVQAAVPTEHFPDEDTLCRTFAPRIRAVARRWAPAGEADDLAHEALIVVLEAVRERRIAHPDALPGYAFAVLRNLARDGFKKEARRADLRARYLPRDTAAPSDLPPVSMSTIGDLLHKLPQREKDVLVRIYTQGQPTEAIAASMGTTPGNVRVLKHRAVARLRQLIDDAEGAR
jgi:RNA polymerase sigma-70 factor (ECF subfamily)